MEQSRYLRPMGLGEILDSSVGLYRENFVPLVMAQLPLTVIGFLILMRGEGTSLFDIFNPSPTSGTPFGGVIVSQLLSISHSFLVYPLTLGAVTKVASDCILKSSPSVKKGYRFSLQNKGKLMVTNLVISLAMGAVLAIFVALPLGGIIPSFFRTTGEFIVGLIVVFVLAAVGIALAAFLWIRWVAAFPILVNEEGEAHGTFYALGRSFNLVEGYTKKMFLVMVAVSLIPYIVQVSPSTVEFLLERSLVIFRVIFGVLAQGIVVPLVGCTRVVIYFELRTRKEGFDLEKRAEEL